MNLLRWSHTEQISRTSTESPTFLYRKSNVRPHRRALKTCRKTADVSKAFLCENIPHWHTEFWSIVFISNQNIHTQYSWGKKKTTTLKVSFKSRMTWTTLTLFSRGLDFRGFTTAGLSKSYKHKPPSCLLDFVAWQNVIRYVKLIFL